MSAAIPLAAGGISAYGAYMQGSMTADSLNRQAQNLTQQAQEAEAKGAYDASRQQVIAGQRIGSIEAGYGASGVTSTSGSAMAVIQASHQNAELDRLNILHGADIRAINYLNQASLNRYGAESARLGSYYSAMGDLALGAARADFGKQAAKTQMPDSGATLDMRDANTWAQGGGEGAFQGSAGGYAGMDTASDYVGMRS